MRSLGVRVQERVGGLICKHQKAKRHRAQMVLLHESAEREALCPPPSEDEAELAKELATLVQHKFKEYKNCIVSLRTELAAAQVAVAVTKQGRAVAVSESEAMAVAHARNIYVAQARAEARESRVAQARADAEVSRVVAMEARKAANAAEVRAATAQARADVALRLAGVYAD
ncbi:hypothetical protein T492DRAFT_1135725 [Pavlovales sp. CCMP2436]|nr:hypothetical protein T492DRAFT_1135725 [Pavlovales sp. CCMP2436]